MKRSRSRNSVTVLQTNSNGRVVVGGVVGGCVNEGGNVVIINVGGQRHEALKKNFDKFPQGRDTLLMMELTKPVLVFNCRIPDFVQLMSMSRICPTYIQSLSLSRYCLIFVLQHPDFVQ